jgi:hypothetical protein
MAEYRSGNDAAAVEALLAAAKSGSNNPIVTDIAGFYRAMCLFRQGKPDEARQLATAAVTRIKPLPKDEQNPLPNNAYPWDDLILWMAYKEAKTLIKFDAVPAASTAAIDPGGAILELEAARKALSALPEHTPAEQRVRTLKRLQTALRKTATTPELKEELQALDSRVASLDQALDREYLATMPPFTSEKFAGRKSKSARTVVMELFTGAQCGHCPAADLGFDGLKQTYGSAEVVLLQYHLHIPRPDPLVNPDAVARAAYYEVHSTPSTVFNGEKAAGGGGPRDHSETKYRAYRQVIDPLLEKGPEATIHLSAKRQGNQIAIEAQVAEVAAPGKNTRLRFALVEERIHYVGSNGIRFHHQVVRAMPGGVQGIALEEKSSRHTVMVNLDELRQKLIEYLDEYAKEHPFSDSDRPLELKNLHVVALVQNDDSGAVLQARQMEVTGEPAAKERQTK